MVGHKKTRGLNSCCHIPRVEHSHSGIELLIITVLIFNILLAILHMLAIESVLTLGARVGLLSQ